MPPIGLLLGNVDFSSLFTVLDASKGAPASLADAKAKGIPVIAYGQFLNDIIGFLIVALAVFLIVKQVNRIKSAVDKPVVADAVTKGVSVLRVDNFDQGVALPELHVRTRTCGSPTLGRVTGESDGRRIRDPKVRGDLRLRQATRRAATRLC